MAPLANPLKLAFDLMYDYKIRPNYLPGVQFTDPPGDTGWFDPDSPLWYVHGHFPSMMIGLGNAGMMELLSPEVVYAGRDHGVAVVRDEHGQPTREFNFAAGPRRFGHSISFFQATAFGPSKAAERAVRAVRGMHSVLTGQLPDGRPYSADDEEVFRWTYCTVVWGIATGHEFYHPRPLSGAALDDYYRQFTRVGEELGGIDLPATKAEVADYLEDYAPKLGLTQQGCDFLQIITPASRFPRPARPAAKQLWWAIMDMAPDWERQLFLAGPRSGRTETKIRRTIMRSLLKGLETNGTSREFQQSQDRVKATAEAVLAADRAGQGLGGSCPVLPVPTQAASSLRQQGA